MEAFGDPEFQPESTTESADAERARLIDRYLELRHQIQVAEAELDSIKDAIKNWLEDGEFVSNGDYFATYQVRVTFDYDADLFRQRLPNLFNRVATVDPKKMKAAIEQGIAREEDLADIRVRKELKALVVRESDPRN